MMDPAVWLEETIPGGAPADQFRLVLCTLFSFPLGYAFKRLPTETLQHVYALVLGLCYGWYCFGYRQMFHPIFVATLTYYLTLKKPKSAAPYVFVIAFAYLCAGHIYRMYNDYMGWTMDYTTAQMLLTLRVVQYACNVQDLHRDEKELHAEEISDRLEGVPGPLQYFAYMFFFPAFLFGPNCSYNQYDAFVKRRQTPSTVVPSLVMLLHSLGCYAAIILSMGVPLDFVITPEFRQMALHKRLLYSWGSVVGGRFRYYFIWCLSEGACTACGVTYNGKSTKKATLWDRVSGAVDGKGNRWDLVKHVNIFGVEFAQNGKEITDNWNMGVGRFLYVYVYQRLSRPGKGRPGTLNIYVTQMLCAFWHGFYPGYYLTFFSTAGAVAVTRTGRRYIRPIVLERCPKLYPVYCFIGWVLTCSCFSWMMGSFMLLGLTQTIQFWNNIHWVPHILAYGGMLLLYVLRDRLVALRKTEAKKTTTAICQEERAVGNTKNVAEASVVEHKSENIQNPDLATTCTKPASPSASQATRRPKRAASPAVGTPPEIGNTFGELTPPTSPLSPRTPLSAVIVEGKDGHKGKGVLMPSISLRRRGSFQAEALRGGGEGRGRVAPVGADHEGSISHKQM